MCSAPGIQSSGESSGVVPGCSARSLLRAVAYDSPVLAIRARTRRLKPACLVMIVSRGPSADPQRSLRRAHDRRMTPRPRGWPPFASVWVTRLGRVAGGWARTVAASHGTAARTPAPAGPTPTRARTGRRPGGGFGCLVMSQSPALCGPGTVPPRRASGTRGSNLGRLGLDEALHERQRGVGDAGPATVNGESVPAARDLGDLGDVLVALLALVRGVGDRWRDSVVLLTGDQQQRATVGILRVALRLGPRVEVSRCGLEERQARSWHGEGLVEQFRLLLADRIGESVAELVVGQRYRALPVGRVAERHRR